jgi:transcriptional regulator with XRE-family HTH domain
MIGERVRMSREELGIKQETLARRVGVSRSYLSLVENDHKPDAKASLVLAIASELGVSPAYLAGWSDDPLQEVPPSQDDVMDAIAALYPVLWRLVSRYQRLPSDDQQAIVDAVLAHMETLVSFAERKANRGREADADRRQD